MILSPENLVYYLMERGLVTRDSAVNGSVEISEIVRRNRNFKVRQRKGGGYFVKQVRQWEPEALRTLRAEAQSYRLAAEDDAFADMAQIIPRLCSYDERRSVLVTELIAGAETVTEHHFKNDSFPVEVGEQLGRAFGNFHRKVLVNPPRNLDGIFPRRVAWALSMHDMPAPPSAGLSGGIHQMLAMIRQFPQLATTLGELRSGWRSDALIHGDIKWENFVLCPGPNGGRSLKIVDWEMADWGDACWDLAGILSAYVTFWVQSLPGNGFANPDIMVAQARFPIERMQPAIRGFWSTYTQCREIGGQEARDLLRRTVLYTGARNIQTAFEVLQTSPQADSGTVLLLQLSMNVLSNPEEAASELLGIEA